MVSVFVGTSVDGFIARRNGAFDFLMPFTEPHGFEEFLASVDAIVMGRNTYESILPITEWPYGNKRVIVLSSKPIHRSAATPPFEQMNGEPAEIVAQLAASGALHLYVDGGITIQRFLRAGLVDRLTITRVPLLIGEGIPLFGSIPRDIQLTHIGTRRYASGLVSSDYTVMKQGQV